MLRVEETGQEAIELLDPLHKLPDWDLVGLLCLIADIKSLGFGRITLEN